MPRTPGAIPSSNPPFAGSLDYETTAKDLLKIVKTKKTELLFVALFLRLLRTGGRAAVIVPDGVLFGSSTAHKEIRRKLVEEHKLEAVIKLPSGVFRPYAGVSTAILLFTKTGVGGTGSVWFYDMTADGFSLDDKRTPLLYESPFTDVSDQGLSGVFPPSESAEVLAIVRQIAHTPKGAHAGIGHSRLPQRPQRLCRRRRGRGAARPGTGSAPRASSRQCSRRGNRRRYPAAAPCAGDPRGLAPVAGRG